MIAFILVWEDKSPTHSNKLSLSLLVSVLSTVGTSDYRFSTGWFEKVAISRFWFDISIWACAYLDTQYTNMVELTGMLKYDSVYLSAWVEVLDSREKLEKSIVGHS